MGVGCSESTAEGLTLSRPDFFDGRRHRGVGQREPQEEGAEPEGGEPELGPDVLPGPPGEEGGMYSRRLGLFGVVEAAAVDPLGDHGVRANAPIPTSPVGEIRSQVGAHLLTIGVKFFH